MLPLLITLQMFTNDVSARIRRDEKGATAVEYGLLVGLIAVVIIVALVALGPTLRDLFQSVNDQMPAPAAPAVGG